MPFEGPLALRANSLSPRLHGYDGLLRQGHQSVSGVCDFQCLWKLLWSRPVLCHLQRRGPCTRSSRLLCKLRPRLNVVVISDPGRFAMYDDIPACSEGKADSSAPETMGQASSVALPSLWELLPHGFGGAPGLDREVNTPSTTEASFPTRDKAEAQDRWQPFGDHVLLSDVVSPVNETLRTRCTTVYVVGNA